MAVARGINEVHHVRAKQNIKQHIIAFKRLEAQQIICPSVSEAEVEVLEALLHDNFISAQKPLL